MFSHHPVEWLLIERFVLFCTPKKRIFIAPASMRQKSGIKSGPFFPRSTNWPLSVCLVAFKRVPRSEVFNQVAATPPVALSVCWFFAGVLVGFLLVCSRVELQKENGRRHTQANSSLPQPTSTAAVGLRYSSDPCSTTLAQQQQQPALFGVVTPT